MRMNLYEIDIERAEGRVLVYLVAADEPRGAELVWEHHEALGLDLNRVHDPAGGRDAS